MPGRSRRRDGVTRCCVALWRAPRTTDRLPEDIARAKDALHRALNLSESDVDDLLRGTTAVLVDLDGSSFYLIVEFLKALGLFCSVGTVGISED